MRWLRRLSWWLGTALLVGSIVQELRQPKEARTWHGKVWGIVPYDLRPPTWQRVKETIWNPADRHLLTGQVFGVGWTLNLYEVQRRMRPLLMAA